jgi:hypothetical protein
MDRVKQFDNVLLPAYTLYTNKANHKVAHSKRLPEIDRPYPANEANIRLVSKGKAGLWTDEKFTITKNIPR